MVIEQRNNLPVIYFNVHKSNIISVSLHKKVRKLPTIRSRTCEKFRLFKEGVVALFETQRLPLAGYINKIKLLLK